MRVIAGSARGLRLTAPPGQDIRPTLDRVRESLFNILMPRIEGARFLDLFAGTGANGIEALSRGAQHAVFVEKDRQALVAIRNNLLQTRLAKAGEILVLDLPRQMERINGSFDIVFADPPYAFDAYSELLEGIANHGLIAEKGLLVIEHARRAALHAVYGALERIRETRYGDTRLSFYA
jgi:16S rRNA (guanine(966)-N(2))-methyltransferase RsmD